MKTVVIPEKDDVQHVVSTALEQSTNLKPHLVGRYFAYNYLYFAY